MRDEQAAIMPPEELFRLRRQCWHEGCKRDARLEWCGWRYCLTHYWQHVLRGQSSWQHLFEKLRFTRLTRGSQ